MLRGDRALDLADDYAALADRLGDGADTDEELDAIFAEFQAAEHALEAGFEELRKLDLEFESRAEQLKVLVKELSGRRSQWERRQAAVRRYMLLLLQRGERQNVRTTFGTIYRTQSKHVVIPDPAAIPDDERWMRVTVAPDMKAVGAALRAGEKLEWARLEKTETVGVR